MICTVGIWDDCIFTKQKKKPNNIHRNSVKSALKVRTKMYQLKAMNLDKLI